MAGAVKMKVIFFANTDWYLYNFRLPLARYFREKGFEVVMISPSGQYGSRMVKDGFRWIVLPMNRRSLNPFREFRLLLYLWRIYIEEQPDFVHHFTIKCVIYGSLVAKMAGIRRRINAVAGLGYIFKSDDLRARWLRPILKIFLRWSLSGTQSRLILQNSDDCSVFESEHVIASSLIRLIKGSGVNTNRFQTIQEISTQSNPYRVLLATRLLWDKGIQEYVEMAKLMKGKLSDIEFLLAGSPDMGNPNSIPEQLLQQWHDVGCITALGHVEQMEALLSKVDLVVLPSSYGEGVPRILIEAAASGLPIITTNTPGCRDIVSHRKNGLLVPPRDAEALGQAVMYFYSNREMGRKMGAAGREKVLAEYDEGIVLNQTLSVYRELMAIECV